MPVKPPSPIGQIQAPTVTLTFPVGGEDLDASTPANITWQTTGSPASHDVLLSLDGGFTFAPLATNLPGSARAFSWTPPPSESDAARIKVVAHSGALQASDHSKSDFAISAPQQLNAPFSQLAGHPVCVFHGNVLPGGDAAFVFLAGARMAEPGTTNAIQIVSKDGTQLVASLPLTSAQSPTFFVAVADIDQDGVDEIVALYPGTAAAAPVIYAYKTKLKNGNLKIRRKFTYAFPAGVGVGKDSVKVYGRSAGGQMIVAAPDTFSFAYAASNSSAPVVFIDGAGNAAPFAVPVKASSNPNDREILTFPGVVAGMKHVVVIAKSRLLVFDKDNPASHMFYQFVDPGSNSFTQYNADADAYEGRRYGLYRLIETSSGTKLIVAADGNIDTKLPPAATAPAIPGAVYEVYPIGITAQAAYLGAEKRVAFENSSIVLMYQRDSNGKPMTFADGRLIPAIAVPDGYQIGAPLNGITTLNSKPLVVASQIDLSMASKPVSVRIVNLEGQAVVNPGISGLCLNVAVDPAGAFLELLVYHLNSQKHSLWRLSRSGGNFTAVEVGTLPGEAAAEFMLRSAPLQTTPDTGVGQNRDHFSIQTAASNVPGSGSLTLVADTGAGFSVNQDGGLTPAAPLGLRSWTELQRPIQISLDMAAARQGKVINILSVPSQSLPIWIIKLDGAPLNRVGFFRQQGGILTTFTGQSQLAAQAQSEERG